MNRRTFLSQSLAGAAALGAAGMGGAMQAESPETVSGAERIRTHMKVGHQHDHSEKTLRALAAFGVDHICSGLPSRVYDDNWSVDGLMRLRRHVESFGIALEMVPLPMSSVDVTRVENPDILLGKSPERDREIEQIRLMIQNAGKAGIPALKYNLTLLGVVRTGHAPGRGGAQYSAFTYNQAKLEPPLTEAGEVSEAAMWERIGYFLERVVPVAEEAKVRLCCHPNDPGMPRGKGFRGVHCVLDKVDGLKRFVQTVPSSYHGLNFCQGTVSEMLEAPGKQIYDVIRWFGSRGKIFNVHFRNIEGSFLNFRETFPDNGSVDMIHALRTYKEVGYSGMIMPDHVPGIEGDTNSAQAFAYCFGYIQALVQVLRTEA